MMRAMVPKTGVPTKLRGKLHADQENTAFKAVAVIEAASARAPSENAVQCAACTTRWFSISLIIRLLITAFPWQWV